MRVTKLLMVLGVVNINSTVLDREVSVHEGDPSSGKQSLVDPTAFRAKLSGMFNTFIVDGSQGVGGDLKNFLKDLFYALNSQPEKTFSEMVDHLKLIEFAKHLGISELSDRGSVVQGNRVAILHNLARVLSINWEKLSLKQQTALEKCCDGALQQSLVRYSLQGRFFSNSQETNRQRVDVKVTYKSIVGNLKSFNKLLIGVFGQPNSFPVTLDQLAVKDHIGRPIPSGEYVSQALGILLERKLLFSNFESMDSSIYFPALPTWAHLAVEEQVSIGRLFGLAFVNRLALPIRIADPIVAVLLGRAPQVEDIRRVFPQQYAEYQSVLDEEIVDSVKIFDLDGQPVYVMEMNKMDTIEKILTKLTAPFVKAAGPFIQAFQSLLQVSQQSISRVVSAHAIGEMLWKPLPIEVAQMRLSTRFEPSAREQMGNGWMHTMVWARLGYTSPPKTEELAVWFWDIVDQFSQKERRELVFLITGSRGLPFRGFAGFLKQITIQILDSPKEPLRAEPSRSILYLPPVTSQAELLSQLTRALVENSQANYF